MILNRTKNNTATARRAEHRSQKETGSFCLSRCDNFIFAMAKKKSATTVKKQFIVVWDESGDPAMVFDTLEKAKEFASALLTKNTDKLDDFNYSGDVDYIEEGSIKVFEGVLIGKPKVTIEFDK